MKLITEEIDLELFTETVDNTKRYYLEGIFMQADTKNKNGRNYPLKMMAPKIEEYNENFVKKNRAFGELGHPKNPIINLDRVSHKFIKLERQGTNFVGKALILNTSKGLEVQRMLDDDCQLAASCRGLGTVVNEDVQGDYHLVTPSDIVHDPSAPDAFVNGIMEGVEWVWNNGVLTQEELEDYKRQIHKTPLSGLKEKKIEIFKRYLNNL